jgi:outer membrane protein assembly factor BamB
MLAVAAAAAVWVDVQVYVDRNANGVRDPEEPPVPGAVVGAGTTEAVADAGGRAQVQVPVGEAVWARAFDGYAVPGPWALPPVDGGAVELGLRPLAPPRGPWRFVVAADSHTQRPGQPVGHEIDLEHAMEQATAGEDPPRFAIICGDMTQDSDLGEADMILRVFGVSPAALVPVMGNHDFYDDGVNWRARFGPDLYSFEVGGVHVMVLDSNRPVHELLAFARADLATVGPDQRVIAATHGPPELELAEVLDALGVELVLAGHWHVNRTLHRGRLVELDTEPWVMGGIDQSPGGYRVIEVTPPEAPVGMGIDRASLDAQHYTTTELPLLQLVGPAPGQCVPPDAPVPIIAAAAGGPDLAPVRASVDGGAPITLAPRGGWDWVGDGPAVGAGPHQVTLRAGRSKRDYDFDACAPRFAPSRARSTDWPQLGGGPGRTGAAAAPLSDRLAPRWVRAVGGQLGAGSPIVAGGLVLVAPLDLADDRRSAVVALDLATGDERWRFAPGAAVRNALAADVDAGVVIAVASDGVVWGLELATGAVRWRVDLGERVWPEERGAWGAPLVAGGRVFAGNQRRFAAIDVGTGRIAWEIDPVPDADGSGSYSSPTLVGDTVVMIPNRVQGVQGWDAATGAPRWATIDTCSVSAAAAPVADGGRAHLISGAGLRCTVDVATGDTGAWGPLDREGFEWAYEIAATPALGHGTLLELTQFGEAFAFDVATEELRWARAIGKVAPVHAAHYRAGMASLAASPVIAGDAAWIGTADGDVVEVDLATGRDRARLRVGAPVLSGLAVAGDSLVVASYDGTVRVFSPARPPGRTWPLAVDVVAVAAVYGGLALLARRRSRPHRRR